ncbi:type II toxin-antitoxin system VapC family toxin [Persicitalea sp.]|uniref:type II toxin-antitoxin system VapC family toxin n=1 Tax=Persicitalea sp. TaxID=3100273 RepID=UPI0035931082
MEGAILDSNTAIYLLNGTLNAISSKAIADIADKPFVLSVIGRIELLGWEASNEEEALKVVLFVRAAVVLPLNEPVIERTIAIRRKYKIKLPDAIIAATALEYNLKLITRNVADFDSIEGLTVVNPFG